MRTSSKVAAGLVGLVLVGSWLPDREPAPQDAPAAGSTEQAAAAPGAPAPTDLLQAAPGGDGDSWRDTSGREYRLGLVNAPETGDCYGSEATAERKAQVARGFRARPYTVDRYGRSVSVVTTADGTNLNVHLARHGFADDRYLQRFRSENPSLAAELEAAFAAAKESAAGLWGACGGGTAAKGLAAPAPAQAPAADSGSGCHPDYVTCLPVKGDGSGRGEANDLDCGDIGQRVQVRQVGVDPYRLDADRDGYGCTG